MISVLSSPERFRPLVCLRSEQRQCSIRILLSCIISYSVQFGRRVFAVAWTNMTLWEQYHDSRRHYKNAAKCANAPGGKVWFKLVTDCIQFYVFANLARHP